MVEDLCEETNEVLLEQVMSSGKANDLPRYTEV